MLRLADNISLVNWQCWGNGEGREGELRGECEESGRLSWVNYKEQNKERLTLKQGAIKKLVRTQALEKFPMMWESLLCAVITR